MVKKIATRREILDRWRGIEEKDDVIWSDPSKQRRFLQDKEEWFSDAFNFLICLPKGIHIWCGSWDIMGPLLETFYNYYKDKRDDSPLKLLWKRISEEMRQCTQCICQHHQAQEMYNSEYELSSIGPLLKVMRSLDEERITQQLIDINAKVSRGEYDPVRDNAEVVSVMFEVLMFPVLLDDQSLVTEFQIFIEAIDESNELTLAGHQQYPGVYALFFLKSRRARSIGLRLARYMGKLRGASDLEPLQPLLKKCIGFLETEVLPSTSETSRPRVQLERINVWLGIKALLGFVEPPAFEEGILEQYPIFLSIVLNHVSDDSLEFTYAVNCLRLLFELLGCKLWLRTTLSPSMMRNTLLGQCFHTRNEKSHKEIFDLFQPFLQSLEALQDGEHEKQRRHFLYFLLHQVTMSSNFSVLMRKKACQISLLIILRGYKMNPPCPPYECVHMWGPSLICSLKNSSLHNSLRQPAFDLIQTIMVSDAAALTTTLLKCRSLPSIDSYVSADLNDDDEDELPFSCDVEEKDDSCWSEFGVQNKFTLRECQGWMCSPLLWFEALVEVDPSILPVSFSKAVFWSLSRLSMVEHEDGVEMLLSVKDWIPLHGGEISASLKWVVPTGSDDGGDGKESINSVKVSTMCIPLIKTFKRFTAHFVVQLELGEHRKQWTWEPRMGESMILLLVDPNDNVRQVDRLILEQVSNSRGLSCGLKFLCSSASSLSAIYLGLRHALKLVQLDSVISRFHNLHHFFFVIRKLLEDAVASPQASPHNPVDSPNLSNFSSQGGFLRHPVLNSSKVNANGCLSNIVDIRTCDKFSISLSGLLWPCIRRCLVEGKAFIDNKSSQMTSVRLLEILPIIFERLSASLCKVNRNSAVVSQEIFDFKWLNDLMDWGNSSLVVIARYWKQAVNSLLDLLKSSSYDNSTCAIDAIEKLVSHESVVTDDLKEQVSRLAVMLSSQALHNVEKTSLRPEPFVFDVLPSEKRWTALNRELSSSDDADVQILDFVAPSESKDRNNVIVLSDDEAEKEVSPDVKLSCSASQDSLFCDKKPPCADKIILQDDHEGKEKVAIVTPKKSPEGFQFRAYAEGSGHVSQKWDLDASGGKLDPLSLLKLKGINEKRGDDPSRKSSSHETTGTKSLKQTYSNVVSDSRDCVIKELVSDIENDPWEVALNSVRRSQSFLAKPSASVPKRQVIQLKLPVGNKAARLHAGVRRLRPPKLDDWYRPILEIDYFYTVGLSSANKDENPNASELKEVPVSFQSPDHYVDIFRPLILEEFKAQLNNSFMEASSSDDMCCGSLSVLSVERIDDFHLVRCVPDERESAASRGCSENDLVLLTKQPLQNSTHDVHMVGKVERRENDNKRRSCILVIRFYLQSSSSRLNKARRLLIERSKWYVSRIMSITPQLREFQALSSLKDIPLLSTILKPNRSLFHNESEKFEVAKLPKSLEQKLKSSFNENQLQAISVAIGSLDSRKDFELSLIQGPPGTGKTRTIVAIVSGLVALLLQEKNAKTKPFCGSLKSSNNFMSVRPQVSQSVAVARAWQDAALARQLVDDGEKNSKSVESFERGRVLICAQSNAAVDELVSRISNQGLYGSDGKMYKPYLVRVGNSRTVHPSSLPFFIDTLVDHRLAEERMSGSVGMCDFGGDSMELRSNLEKLVDRIRFYEAKRASLGDGNVDSRSSMEDRALKEDNGQEMSDAAIGAKLRKLYEQKKEICIDLAAAQSREKKSSEELKTVKRKIRNSILKEAEIVLTTLSGCGGDLYGVCSESVSSSKFGNSSEHTLFDAVVIDEAAQALEPATLIPLQLLKSSGTRCIMVGDPKQLPATVLSNVASKFLYQCSMFERLQRAGHPVVMLTEQYRMHPEICRFPSLHFYDSKLLNGGQMAAKAAQFHETIYLGPYVFYDVIDGQERRGRNSGMMSLNNEFEVDAAVELLKFFRKRYPSEFVAGRIAIITPYKSQVSLLRSRVSVAFGTDVTADIEFNTVDGFQGREVDILILSTVRASDPHFAAQGINSSSIGFVADIRRMNVALTRARLSLWILGNANTLKKNENWAALIKDAEGRDLVIPIAKPYESIFKKPFSGSMVIPTPDRSHRTNSHLKHMKQVEKVKDNSLYADQYESNPMETSEWRTKYIRNGAERKRSRASDYVKDDSSTKRHRTSDAISKADSMSSQNIEPTMARKYVKDGEGKFKEKDQKQINLGSSSHSRKAKTPREDSGSENNQVHFLQETDANNKFKLKLSDGPLKSSENDKSKRKEVSIYPAESNNDERDVTEGGRASAVIETPKDAIAMRKQQRDAVDALLSSALISSKKPGTSSKPAPVTRPLSSSSGAVKPPKPRKASMLQDKETG